MECLISSMLTSLLTMAKLLQQNGIDAVSYTHLDVYKRQVQSAAFYLELLTRNSYFVAKIRILLIYKKHCTIYYVP